jgi:hypothetical protein
MSLWQPRTQQLGRLPDFLVSYRFFTAAEGGRSALPHQGYRSDLCYERNHIINGKEYDGLYMVWPEFLDERGIEISNTESQVPPSGNAYMWIVNFDSYSDIHRTLAVPGACCWFMEGSRRVAEASVVRQIGLLLSMT